MNVPAWDPGGDACPVFGLRLVAGASPADEADAVDFLRASGLPLSGVVLGLFDQSDDCIKIVGTDGTLQFMNCNGKRAMQIDDFGAIAGKPWHALWPDESQPLITKSVEEAKAGKISRFDAFCPTAKGDPRWWEVTVSPVRAPSGEVQAVLSTSRDITDRRRREEAAATVALEMRHRLRNAHAIGAAVLLASGRAAPDHHGFAQDVAARLARLSEVHAHLVDVGGGMPLEELCKDVAEVFDHSGGHLNLGEVADVTLDEDRARAISLILGELATNSLKHGALGHGGRADLDGVVDGDTLTLDWSERFDAGDGKSSATSSGQGADLMRRIIRLYRGAIESGTTADGYRATITLPLV